MFGDWSAVFGETPPAVDGDPDRALASVVWDALALGRRAEVASDLERIIGIAGDRYALSVSEWVTRARSYVRTLECRFCREVLREVRRVRIAETFQVEPVAWSIAEPCPHGERCAAGVVAKLVTPIAVARQRARRERHLPRLPVHFEMDTEIGDYHVDVPTTIYGEGFRRKGRVAVWFGETRARIVRIESDTALVVIPPPFIGSAVVRVRVGRTITTLEQRFYTPQPSPY